MKVNFEVIFNIFYEWCYTEVPHQNFLSILSDSVLIPYLLSCFGVTMLTSQWTILFQLKLVAFSMAIIFFTLTGDKEPTINLQTHLSKKIHKKITHRIYEVKISNKLRNVINNCKRELDSCFWKNRSFTWRWY